MKKLFPTTATRRSFAYIQSAHARAYVFSALIFLTSCTSTQVRWDAVKMRQDVMVYYNDQIMENLIKAENHLPFVHVDIQSLTSQGASQITGTVGYGETTTNTSTSARTNQITTTDTTNTSPPGTIHSVATVAGGLLASASHAAMRPFGYSVSPTRTETLTITAAPALGSQALVSTTPASKGQEPTPSPSPELTKRTVNFDASHNMTSSTDENTVKPAATPTPITIYELYAKYAKPPPKGILKDSPTRPREKYVPGTLKSWDNRYYYIRATDKDKYYELCEALFTKGQAGSLEQKIQENRAEIETLKTFQAAPAPPPPP